MIVIGLTGSIGMGKSFAAKQFEKFGALVFDADKEVHKLMHPGGAAFKEVSKKFPDAVKSGKIDRKALGKIVYSDDKKLKALEKILHPKVREAEISFIKSGLQRRAEAVVLDIPLLFETGADNLCDLVVVVAAPEEIQESRALSRDGAPSKKQLDKINDLQLSTKEKIKRADFVIRTGLDKRFVLKQVKQIMNFLKES